MRKAWTVIRKDFIRVRWLLAGWVLCQAVPIGMGFSLVYGFRGAPQSSGDLDLATGGCSIIAGVLTFFITAILVQQPGVADADSGSATRPLGRVRSFVTRLLGWLAMLWLPAVLLALPWWTVCGFGLPQMARGAWEILAVQAAVALPVALVAGLTDTLGRVLVWSFVLLFAGVTIPMMTAFWAGENFSGSHLAVSWTLFSGGLAVVEAGRCFRRGKFRWLVVIGGLASLTALFVGQGSDPARRFLRGIFGPAGWTEWRPERAKDITLAVHSFSLSNQGRPSGARESYLTTNFAAGGVAPGLILAGEEARQAWRWPEGPELKPDLSWIDSWGAEARMRPLLGVEAPPHDAETERFQAAQKDRALKRQGESYVRRVQALNDLRRTVPLGLEVTAMVLPSFVERMKSQPPNYRASLQLTLLRPRVWMEVPLGPSGWQSQSNYGFRLGAGLKKSTALERWENADGKWVMERRPVMALPIVFTMPAFVWERIFDPEGWRRELVRTPVFYVIHRAGGDAQRQYLYFRHPSSAIAGVGIIRDVIRISPPMVRRGDGWVPRDADWLAGTRVVLVGQEVEARFNRDVNVERYSQR